MTDCFFFPDDPAC
jgi:hypothetical protein